MALGAQERVVNKQGTEDFQGNYTILYDIIFDTCHNTFVKYIECSIPRRFSKLQTLGSNDVSVQVQQWLKKKLYFVVQDVDSRGRCECGESIQELSPQLSCYESKPTFQNKIYLNGRKKVKLEIQIHKNHQQCILLCEKNVKTWLDVPNIWK